MSDFAWPAIAEVCQRFVNAYHDQFADAIILGSILGDLRTVVEPATEKVEHCCRNSSCSRSGEIVGLMRSVFPTPTCESCGCAVETL